MNGRTLLIQGGRPLILDGDLDDPRPADILVADGRIVELGNGLQARYPDAEILDASDCLVIPGLVNAHYHSHDTLLRGCFEQLPLDAWMLYTSPAQFPRLSRQELRLRTSIGAAECLLNGITTVQDMVTLSEASEEQVESIVSAYIDIGLRAVVAIQFGDRAPCDCVAFWNELPLAAQNLLPAAPDKTQMRALIAKMVGARHERIHWALGPSAPQRCSEDLLKWMSELSQEHKLQVFSHVYETRGQAVFARMNYSSRSLIDHLDQFGLLNDRLTMAHGVWISDEEIAKCATAGVNLAFNPYSNLKMLNGFAPIHRYWSEGVNIALGCDNCSGSDAQNIFEAMKMFAINWGMNASVGQSGAAREAFRAATIGGARALGLGDEIGQLKPGYRADLVLIDLNSLAFRPLNSAVRQLVYSENGKGVHTVVVGGEVVVRNRTLVTMKDHELRTGADVMKERLRGSLASVRERNDRFLNELISSHTKAEKYPMDFDRLSIRN